MENVFTFAVLVLAVVCVLAATRPARTSERSRRAPTDRKLPPEAPGKARSGEPTDPNSPNAAAPRRWDRRDLARALAIDLVAPGAEGEPWPA